MDELDREEAIVPNHTIGGACRWRLWLATSVAAAVILGAVAIAAATTPRPQAQSQQTAADNPTFEVASVKPNKSGDLRVLMGVQPGGRFTATNVPLRVLIRNAYRLQDTQIVGGPSWLNSDRFDVVAKAEGDVPPGVPGGPPGALQLMRSLLPERFKLAAHHETRELPIYWTSCRGSSRPTPLLPRTRMGV